MKRNAPMTRLMGDVMKLWYLYIPSVLSTIAYIVFDMISNTTMGQVVDAVLLLDADFWWKFGVLLLAPIAAAPFHTISMLTKFGMGERLVTKLRIDVGKKSTQVAIPALEKQVSGDIMTHLGEEMEDLGWFAGYGLSEVTTLFAVGIGTVCFMAVVDMPLTLLFLLLSVAVLPLSLVLSRSIKKNEKKRRDALNCTPKVRQYDIL